MAKASRFGSDTELNKHMAQPGLYAHDGSQYFIPKRQFYNESLSPRFSAITAKDIVVDDEVAYRGLYYKTDGVSRWSVGINDTAESGSEVGSDFELVRYDDSGASLGIVMFVARSSGNIEFRNTQDNCQVIIKAITSGDRARLLLDSPDAHTEIYFQEGSSLKQAISYSPSDNFLGIWNSSLNSGSGAWAWKLLDSDGWIENSYNATDGATGVRLWGGTTYYAQIFAPSQQQLKLIAPNHASSSSYIDIKPQGTDYFGVIIRQYDNDSYYGNFVMKSQGLYIGASSSATSDMVKIWNSGTDKGLVTFPSSIWIASTDSKPFITIGATQRITSIMTGIEFSGGTSSGIFSVQDGSGRVQLKWNATTGTSETFLESSENTFFWDWSVSGNPYFEMHWGGSGTQGNPITWTSHFSLYQDGRIYCSPDSDVEFRFGRVSLSNVGVADFAHFSHVDVTGGTDGYALLQSSTGETYLNAATGQNLHLRIANSDRFVLNASDAYFVGEVCKLNQTTNPLNAMIWNTSLTDLSGSMTESTTYQDLDLTAYSSANAKGVIISVTCNRLLGTGGSSSGNLFLRKNGSSVGHHVQTEFFCRNDSGGNITYQWSAMLFCPCDTGQVIEWKVDHTATKVVNFYVVGYWE